MNRVHRKKSGNTTVWAQFIVPLQPSCNWRIQNYYKIIYDTLCMYFAFKYFLAFWGITIILTKYKKSLIK